MTPALGFASNLSHTIIREAQEDDAHSVRSDHSISTDVSITDEELALLGPPWAKEGMLCRKQYWESTGKRAKSKNWMDVFVVIQKGELSMFTFGDHSVGGSAVVGGGNWLVRTAPRSLARLRHSFIHDRGICSCRKTQIRSAWSSCPIHWPMRCPLRDTIGSAHTAWS